VFRSALHFRGAGDVRSRPLSIGRATPHPRAASRCVPPAPVAPRWLGACGRLAGSPSLGLLQVALREHPAPAAPERRDGGIRSLGLRVTGDRDARACRGAVSLEREW